ncbi:hypothetical protein PsorP6_002285 [Peronosclerospora sorghi]|uniref:Uncharacterized protein n=1 Tax=Peronosclerospora sorghi TaxID=230839 RepID=A0ACC0WU32_9STRA|nr:hypothetical protein PsorP6_002285 [Peronosclerospora sorghi]
MLSLNETTAHNVQGTSGDDINADVIIGATTDVLERWLKVQISVFDLLSCRWKLWKFVWLKYFGKTRSVTVTGSKICSARPSSDQRMTLELSTSKISYSNNRNLGASGLARLLPSLIVAIFQLFCC